MLASLGWQTISRPHSSTEDAAAQCPVDVCSAGRAVAEPIGEQHGFALWPEITASASDPG